jgi:hypothetical protein
VLVSVLPIDQGDEGRSAKRGWDIPPLEQHAFVGEFIQVRGFNLRVSHETVIGPSLVIGNNVENIGRLLGI